MSSAQSEDLYILIKSLSALCNQGSVTAGLQHYYIIHDHCPKLFVPRYFVHLIWNYSQPYWLHTSLAVLVTAYFTLYMSFCSYNWLLSWLVTWILSLALQPWVNILPVCSNPQDALSLYSPGGLLNLSNLMVNSVWQLLESWCDCTVFFKVSRVYDSEHLLWLKFSSLLWQPGIIDVFLSIFSFNVYINNTGSDLSYPQGSWPATQLPSEPQHLSPSCLILASFFDPSILITRAGLLHYD